MRLVNAMCYALPESVCFLLLRPEANFWWPPHNGHDNVQHPRVSTQGKARVTKMKKLSLWSTNNGPVFSMDFPGMRGGAPSPAVHPGVSSQPYIQTLELLQCLTSVNSRHGNNNTNFPLNSQRNQTKKTQPALTQEDIPFWHGFQVFEDFAFCQTQKK